MRIARQPFVLAGVFTASMLAGCGNRMDESEVSSAEGGKRRTVTALGRIEPGEGIITITGPMGERIHRVLVKPGQMVKAGEQLIETLSEPVLAAQIELARARAQQAQDILEAEKAHGEALLAEAQLGVQRAAEIPDLQIASLDAEVKVIEVQLQQAERDLERVKQLTAQVEVDRHTQAVDRYREQLRAARSKLRLAQKEKEFAALEAERRLASAKAGTGKAERAIDVTSAQRQVALAEAELARVAVLSPIDAQVLEVVGQPAESMGQRPVLTLGRTSEMFVRAEVYEADVRFINVGQPATIKSPALVEPLTGVVDRIGQVVKRNEVYGVDPTARSDARVIDVRIRLDKPEPAGQRIGLQVDVIIDVENQLASAGST